jgi:hypothetical protein
VEAETALVGTESGVELHAISLLDLALALVVLPDNAELDDALGDRDDLKGLLVFRVLGEEGGGLKGGDELCEVSDRVAMVEHRVAVATPWSRAGAARVADVPFLACSNSGSDMMS